MHNVVLPVDLSTNMKNDESTEYKTVRGLTRGLMLLNMLNRLDGGASVGLLAELSGLHRTTVRRLLETLQDEGYVRRSLSDDSFRLTIKVRQLSEGFRDEQWISALAAPLLGDLLREVIWPTDVSTLDVDAMVVRETTHRFSRLSFHRAMVGRRLPLLKTASGLTWLAFCPENERSEADRNTGIATGRRIPAGARTAEAGRHPDPRAQRRFWTELSRLGSGGENRLYRRANPQRTAGDRLPEPGVYGQCDDHRTGRGKTPFGLTKSGEADRRRRGVAGDFGCREVRWITFPLPL